MCGVYTMYCREGCECADMSCKKMYVLQGYTLTFNKEFKSKFPMTSGWRKTVRMRGVADIILMTDK
jgi:hypothetical protein